jgi:hypothetical protein
MLRRVLTLFLAAIVLAAVASHSDSFWITRDWRLWSQYQCEIILTDSPWGKKWEYSSSEDPRFPIEKFSESIQIYSALPVRQALVRRDQIVRDYTQISDLDKRVFDASASDFLNQSFTDSVVFRVDFSRERFTSPWPPHPGDVSAPNIPSFALVTQSGEKIHAVQAIPDLNAHAYKVFFPRMENGLPILKAGDHQFRFQFPNSVNHKIEFVDFDLRRMTWNGRTTF